MAYVELNDYSRVISQFDLNEILEEASEDYSGKTSTKVRQDAEAMAEAKIKMYLRDRYDMVTELALTPADNRDQAILMCYLHLTVYFIHFVVSPRDIPKLRAKSYNECISTLEKIRNGDMSIDLTPIEDTSGSVLIQGNSKFISKAFSDGSVISSSNTPENP